MQQELQYTRYNIYFCPKKDFKQPVDFSNFWSIASNFPGHLFRSIYIFHSEIFSSDRLVAISFLLLVMMYCQSLVDPPLLELIHYGKREILRKISNMEMEYSALMTWSTHQGPPSDSSGQWGHNIKVVGVPQHESGSKRKSFMADTFGFANDGELQGIVSYLRSHGGFELEQVRPELPYFSMLVVKRPVDLCLIMVTCIIFNTVDCVSTLFLSRPSTS